MLRARLGRVLLLLVVSWTGLAPSGPVAAQSSGLPDMRWVSPTWGFTVRWFSSEWTVAEDRSADGIDVLSLADTLGNRVTFQGAPAFGGDAEACLDALLAEAQSSPGATGLRLAQDAAGEPYEHRSASQAYAAFTLRGVAADGMAWEFAAYGECQTLVPGVAVLQRILTGPPEVFDRWYDDLVATLEGALLPASAWEAVDPADQSFVWAGVAPLAGAERLNAALMLDEQDRPRLLIGLEAESGTTRMVTFENVGAEPLRIAPADVQLTLISVMAEAADQPWPQTAIRWEDGFAVDGDGSRMLAPGERATALLDFAPGNLAGVSCDTLPLLLLSYQPSGEAGVEFAESRLPNELRDCLPSPLGPAMGRPVFAPASAPLPPAGAVTREPLLTDQEGQLDHLGRIPLMRIAMNPGASLAELPSGPLAILVEWGTVEIVLDNTTITIPAGEILTAETGAGLVARTGDGVGATLLLLSLAPAADWAETLVDDPFAGIDVELLIPEQALLERSAAHGFAVDRATLPPGASLTLGEDGTMRPEYTAVLVESGSVTVRDPVGTETNLAAGGSRRVSPGAAVAAAADQTAEVLLVDVLPSASGDASP